MKTRSSIPYHFLYLLTIVTPMTEAASNRKPVANSGIDQVVGFSTPVTLDGSRSFDSDGTVKKYQWLQITGTKVALAGALTAKPVFKMPAQLKNQQPLPMVFQLTVTDNQGAVSRDTVTVTAVTRKLNDTGITRCSNIETYTLKCPVANFPGQDAQYGRDKIQNNNKDGLAGFSFTKISSNGIALPATAKNWSCVKDNVTGLMWEVKTNDNGLHNKDWVYSWYEPDKRKNGGDAGTKNGGECGKASACDTYAYVKAVNSVGWCGSKDWRLPNMQELLSLVSYDRRDKVIDEAYFPDPAAYGTDFWSSSPDAKWTYNAWSVYFYAGTGLVQEKKFGLRIRLVRNGQ